MFKINEIEIENPLLLAPMEDVTAIGFRKLCKEMGADIVYTEFVNSDGLIRNNKKTAKKMEILDEERPVGIQIYGSEIDAMVEAAKMAEEMQPDIIDINAGCWVKKVVKRGAGSGLLKDPDYMEAMVKAIVDAVDIPVTVKTRIGWDADSINICDVAKRLENVGAKELTIHCRHSRQGHAGEPDWTYVAKVKEVVKIPVVLNGGVFSAEDAKRAFEEIGADGVMIARGAINHPWIFREAKHLIATGKKLPAPTFEERITTALKHLRYEIEYKEEERHAVIPFRKYYSGYLKGLHGSSKIRQELMKYVEYTPIEEVLLNYLEELRKYEDN
jgi:tRNA-dihydrouridine synthase B